MWFGNALSPSLEICEIAKKLVINTMGTYKNSLKTILKTRSKIY